MPHRVLQGSHAQARIRKGTAEPKTALLRCRCCWRLNCRPNSAKKDRYCEILDYQDFTIAVPAKIGDKYLERIPASKASNYWRFGVREISANDFEAIRDQATLSGYTRRLPHPTGDFQSFGPMEGSKRTRYTTYYERNPFHRSKALELHGLDCMACGMNFESQYGDRGAGFIHVHHNKPISETGATRIDAGKDLSVVCPNCHAMIHRVKSSTLSLAELRVLLSQKQGL